MSDYSDIRAAIIAKLTTAESSAQIISEGQLDGDLPIVDHVLLDLYGPDITWDASDVLGEVVQAQRWDWHIAALIPGVGAATDALAYTLQEAIIAQLQGYSPLSTAQKIEIGSWTALGVMPTGTLYQLDINHTLFKG
jgi:hypothetical protein